MKRLFCMGIIVMLMTPILQIKAQSIEAKLGGNTNVEAFEVTSSDNTVLMTVKGNGNIGIGTETPTRGKLEVEGSISTGEIGIRWQRIALSISDFSGNWIDSGVNIGIDPSRIISISGVLTDQIGNKIPLAFARLNGIEWWAVYVDASGVLYYLTSTEEWTGTDNAQILIMFID